MLVFTVGYSEGFMKLQLALSVFLFFTQEKYDAYKKFVVEMMIRGQND